MRKKTVTTWLVCSVVGLFVGVSICAGTDAQLGNSATSRQPGPTGLSATELVEKKVSRYGEPFSTDMQQHVQQTALSRYIIYSSSGSGHAMHLFVKIPHLRNARGVVFAGVIVYTGLTALTMVWKLTNGTSRELVDIGIGPHVVMFSGIGYSSFNRIRLGGGGSLVALCFTQPSLKP